MTILKLSPLTKISVVLTLSLLIVKNGIHDKIWVTLPLELREELKHMFLHVLLVESWGFLFFLKERAMLG